MSIRGVGAANLAGGITNVYFERLPVVAVCESIPSSMAQGESVQHCDQEMLFERIAKYQSVLTPDGADRNDSGGFFSGNGG